jgi:AcrR family transcriptional regulator
VEIENKKYQDILQTAKELFWKYGFRKISIEEICKKSCVSKMTFYKFFQNKLEIAKTVVKTEAENGEVRMKSILHNSSSISEKLQQMIQIKIDGTNGASEEFIQDFYLGGVPELKAYVEEVTRNLWDSIMVDIKEAQAKGIFRKDLNPEFLIHFSFRMVDLMKDEVFTRLYPSPQALILEFTNLVTYGISPRK